VKEVLYESIERVNVLYGHESILMNDLYGFEYAWSSISNFLTTIAAAIIVTVVWTRYQPRFSSKNDLELKPYWLPYIGHAAQFYLFPHIINRWVAASQDVGAFKIYVFGKIHVIIHNPSLWKSDIRSDDTNHRTDVSASAKSEMVWNDLIKVFGFHRSGLGQLHYLEESFGKTQDDNTTDEMIKTIILIIKANINDLATFAESPVDMMPWERSSIINVSKLSDSAFEQEVNFMHLVRDFVAHITIPSVFGSDMVNTDPSILGTMWTFDRAYSWLATGLPRWIPLMQLSRGHNARYRLLKFMHSYGEAVDEWHKGNDSGAQWSSLDDVSVFLEKKLEILRDSGMTKRARSPLLLTLFWNTSTTASRLVFWMLIRIYSDIVLLSQLRAEIHPYLKIRMPSSEFAAFELPTIDNIDHQRLLDKCPLLSAAYNECIRLYSTVRKYDTLDHDIKLCNKQNECSIKVAGGSNVCFAYDLHNHDPQAFPNPQDWNLHRHVSSDDNDHDENINVSLPFGKSFLRISELRGLYTYSLSFIGDSQLPSLDAQFIRSAVLIIIASILSLWDISPKGSEWKIPQEVRRNGISDITGTCRVRIKRHL